MKPRILSSARLSFLLAGSIAALLSSASAAIITWDAGGGGGAATDGAGAWLGPNLWNNATVAATWTSGDDAIFGNAGAGGAVTLASPTTVNSLTLNSFTGTYTLGTVAQTITLNNGITKNTGAGAATIISPVTLGAAQSWNNNSLGLLTIGTGAVTNGGFLLTIGGTGNTTVSSVISGASGLTKSDAGIATLSGANTYGGATTINGGILAASTLANGGATSGIGNSSNAATNLVFGSPTGTLRYTGSTVTTDRGLTLSSGAGGGATIEASGVGASNNLGTLTLNNTVPISSGTVDEIRTLTLGGTNVSENNFGKALADNGTGATSLVKAGAGTWVLTAANTYTGGSTVSLGALVFRTLAAKSATGTHAFGAGTTLGLGVGGANFTSTDVDNAFSGALGGNLSNVTLDATTNVGIDTTAGTLAYATNIGSVTRGLTKFGTSTLTLSGSSAYTGATTVVGGTLAVATLANAGANSSIGNFATAGATGLILSGGTFSYTGASTTTDRGFSSIGNAVSTINVGTGVNLTLGASLKNEINSGLTFSATGAGSSITISSLTVTPGTNADYNISTNNPTVTIQNLNVSGFNVMVQRTGTALVNIGNINGSGGANGWLGNMNVTGVISGYTGNIILGSEAVNLTGLNTSDFNEVLVQQGGIYTINTIKNVGGGASSFGNPSTAARGRILFGNGGNNPTLKYIGTGGADGTTDRVLHLRGAGTLNLEQAGTGLLKFTGNTTADTGNTGAKILNFTGSTAGTGEFSGNIVEHTTTNKTSVSKNGTGTWTLSGANIYTGTTTVNAGTLLINNTTGSGTGTGAATVNAGTLGGTGSISGAVTIGNGTGSADAILAPGTSIESLNTGNLTFASDGSYACELNGSSTTSDQTIVTGAVSINATTTLTVSLTGSLAPGQEYFIVDNDGGDAVTGTFSGLAQGATVGNYGGTDLKISYVGDSGTSAVSGGNDIVLYTEVSSSAYDTWKAANAPGSNPYDDTDGDGVDNAVEFVLGGTSLTKDLDKLPVGTTSGANMVFTFKRAVSSIDPKTAVSIETSTDLATWNTAPSPYTVGDNTAGSTAGVTVLEDTPVGFDTVTLTVLQAPDAKKFARLKVVITP